MNLPYKYNEFENIEAFQHCGRHGGEFTYLSELPNDTKFYVNNGAWKGKVVHKESGIYLQTTLNDGLCFDGSNQIKIDKQTYYWITLIKED